MDSERISELKHDKEEIPESILERARGELREEAWNELNFDVILDALAEIPEVEQRYFTMRFKEKFGDFISVNMFGFVKIYLEPSQESVQQRAEEILAELDGRKGEPI